jgi:hypothetical protein
MPNAKIKKMARDFGARSQKLSLRASSRSIPEFGRIVCAGRWSRYVFVIPACVRRQWNAQRSSEGTNNDGESDKTAYTVPAKL